MAEISDRSQEAQARSNLYGLLARLYRAELDELLLPELRCPQVAEPLAAAGIDVAAVLPPGDDPNQLLELARDYCNLFLLTFSPHESVQRGEGQLWGEYTLQVRAEMEDLGLVPGAEQSLLPDHLAMELELMQHLAAAEANLLALDQAGDAAAVQARQRRFLQEHLLKWAPAFLSTVERVAAHPFYAALAGFTVSFLLSEGA